jgi:hypothetical protein
VQKSTKARGEFLKCPQCNNEFTRDEAGNFELAALANSPEALKPARKKPAFKKASPVKKAAAVKKAAPVKKAAAAKKAAPRKKAVAKKK